jgi:P-type Mg2+ transporter
MTLATTPATAAVTPHPGVTAAAVADIDDVFASVRSTPDGLSTEQATQRRRTVGPNTVETHRARLWPVLIAQVRSPLLLLLVIAAAVSYVVGEHTDAIIIGVIVTLSVGLGVINEYRAARAADLLHDEVRRQATAWRDGSPVRIDVAGLVPGDVVDLRLGDIVPADLR